MDVVYSKDMQVGVAFPGLQYSNTNFHHLLLGEFICPKSGRGKGRESGRGREKVVCKSIVWVGQLIFTRSHLSCVGVSYQQ